MTVEAQVGESEEALEWVETAFTDRQDDYEKYQDYYDGRHKVELTDRLREFLKVSEKAFNANFCEPVVDAMTDRLAVVSFDTDEEDAEDAPLAAWAQDAWAANRMDGQQRVAHEQAAIKGDAYVLCEWDARRERVRLAVNAPDLIRPRYDPADRDRTLWTAKRWGLTKPDRQQLNLYFPDRIEKYQRGAAGARWEQRQDAEGEPWPIPWTGADGEPLGIPVVHLRNKPGVGSFGRSELQNIVPLQNVLNKTLVDLIMVLDTLGFQQRWLVNAQRPSGGFKIYPGVVWNVAPLNPDAAVQLGQFPSESPEGLIAALREIVEEIAGVSRTPTHMLRLGPSFPSGEALQTAEQGLVSKVRSRQVVLGNAWEDVMALARAVAVSIGGQAEIPEGAFSAVWADPETRNELAHVQTIGTKVGVLGVPQVQAWREVGYSPSDIERMLADKRDEKVGDANLGAAILRGFSSGAEE